MIFKKTGLEGAYVIEIEEQTDGRGFFARSFCAEELEANGINSHIVQCNISFNRSKGTLRGMHFQAPPHEEAKLVRCTAGAIYDVIVDLRPGSPTFRKWFSVELTFENRKTVAVPEGFAHGFQTLVDSTEVFYQMSEHYHPEAAGGVRWDDPALSIEWPVKDPIVSEKDNSYPFIK